MGFVDEEVKRAWLATADVLALPAINDGLFFEGFGLTLYEAGASGTAVVGTDGCGVADAIEHGLTGLIVAQDNVAEELPKALLELLSNPQKAAKMGAAGRERAFQQSWDKVAAQVIDSTGKPWARCRGCYARTPLACVSNRRLDAIGINEKGGRGTHCNVEAVIAQGRRELRWIVVDLDNFVASTVAQHFALLQVVAQIFGLAGEQPICSSPNSANR